MNTAIVVFLIAALFGVTLVLCFGPEFRRQNRRIEADIEFMRAIPRGVERADQ